MFYSGARWLHMAMAMHECVEATMSAMAAATRHITPPATYLFTFEIEYGSGHLYMAIAPLECRNLAAVRARHFMLTDTDAASAPASPGLKKPPFLPLLTLPWNFPRDAIGLSLYFVAQGSVILLMLILAVLSAFPLAKNLSAENFRKTYTLWDRTPLSPTAEVGELWNDVIRTECPQTSRVCHTATPTLSPSRHKTPSQHQPINARVADHRTGARLCPVRLHWLVKQPAIPPAWTSPDKQATAGSKRHHVTRASPPRHHHPPPAQPSKLARAGQPERVDQHDCRPLLLRQQLQQPVCLPGNLRVRHLQAGRASLPSLPRRALDGPGRGRVQRPHALLRLGVCRGRAVEGRCMCAPPHLRCLSLDTMHASHRRTAQHSTHVRSATPPLPLPLPARATRTHFTSPPPALALSAARAHHGRPHERPVSSSAVARQPLHDWPTAVLSHHRSCVRHWYLAACVGYCYRPMRAGNLHAWVGAGTVTSTCARAWRHWQAAGPLRRPLHQRLLMMQLWMEHGFGSFRRPERRPAPVWRPRPRPGT